MTQTVFTVITEVDPERVGDLEQVLARIGPDLRTSDVLPLGDFETLHFASLVLARDATLPPTLIFEHNVDGSLDAWLATLVARASPALDVLYSNCIGYPAGDDGELKQAYLAAHVVRPGAYHIGATGRTRARIGQEAQLRQGIEDYVEAEMTAGRLPGDPVAIRSAIRAFVAGDPAFAWAKPNHLQAAREQLGAMWERVRPVLPLVILVPVAVVLLPLLVPLLVGWAVVLRGKELTDDVRQDPAGSGTVEALSRTEDFVAQNHLASVIPVKPGLLRAVTLPVVLYVVNLSARVLATKGTLAGIPSIHFAHWSRINGGRHLLFLSNFDGSWESYLGDFIDKGHAGLSAVWSNTVNFPRTRLLVEDGAEDGPQFRQWARAKQCPTAAWYSAYPNATMPIIDNNTAIHKGLYGAMDKEEAQAWLRRL